TDPGGNSLRADANPLARAGDVRLGAAKPPGPRDRTRHVLRNIPPLLVAAAQPVCGLATGELCGAHGLSDRGDDRDDTAVRVHRVQPGHPLPDLRVRTAADRGLRPGRRPAPRGRDHETGWS